jgi:tetratricopeptide (TPR) repeat protein
MRRSNRRHENVIHVSFGPGGGRVRAMSSDTPTPSDSASSRKEPLTDLFTRAEISRLLGMSTARLRSLDRTGVVSPSARKRGRRAYTFQDLIALRAAQSLLDKRVRLRDVTRAIELLKTSLPRVTRPLAELRVMSDGRKVVVRDQEGASYEPLTGQMVLDFDVKSLRDDVVRVLRPTAGRERARTAYELYLRASQLDEDPATLGEAATLYERAVQLDPWLAIAYTNLGNIRFRSNDPEGAESLYRKALDVDPNQPEAQYNLGYVMLERGLPEAAVPLFEGALASDPKFSDAYFNLAMALEQIGEVARAHEHWRNYIALEPTGTWTEIAKRHL